MGRQLDEVDWKLGFVSRLDKESCLEDSIFRLLSAEKTTEFIKIEKRIKADILKFMDRYRIYVYPDTQI
tara:strand:- start:69 stop:275 length:207 start_codon:yes stop_codon:yes gene_type:complete